MLFIAQNLRTSMEAAVSCAPRDAGVGGTTRWMVGTIPIFFPASVTESGPSRRLLVNCDMARMGDGFDSRTPAPAGGSAISTPSENGGAAMEGVSMTRAQLHAGPAREFTALRHEVPDPASISGTSAAPTERHESSRPAVCGGGDSAAMHHEAQTSAAHEKRHESSRIHCALDDSAASPKRLEMSGLSVDTSAAERLEKSSLATVDDSAAGDSRWSRELADVLEHAARSSYRSNFGHN
ncbi:hypothetical protein B0H13DRAFT_2443948 [Mycena leptocephala]|nr:hypothetical protein B0H13DRAFT_2443948 [Mycena leptocephala]